MRSRSSSACLLLAFAVVAAAQQPATATKPDEKPASIEGVVRNAMTGEPIQRAHVMADGFVANRQQQFGAMSNAEGKFSITGMLAGNYSITIDKTAFVAPVRWRPAGNVRRSEAR
jgi:hypothetical protein